MSPNFSPGQAKCCSVRLPEDRLGKEMGMEGDSPSFSETEKRKL